MVIEQSKKKQLAINNLPLQKQKKSKHGKWTTRDEIIFLNQLPKYVKDRRFQGFTEKPLLMFLDGYINSLPLRKRGFESVNIPKVINHVRNMRQECIRGNL